jgi:hypothetical protein
MEQGQGQALMAMACALQHRRHCLPFVRTWATHSPGSNKRCITWDFGRSRHCADRWQEGGNKIHYRSVRHRAYYPTSFAHTDTPAQHTVHGTRLNTSSATATRIISTTAGAQGDNCSRKLRAHTIQNKDTQAPTTTLQTGCAAAHRSPKQRLCE